VRFNALLALGLVLPLQAGSLEDLRAALNRMQGGGTLRGAYSVNTWSRAGKGKDVEESTRTASVWVEEDPSGLQFHWDRALLKRAEEEAQVAKGSRKPDTPTVDLSAVNASEIHSAVNFAPKLARLLATGLLKQERPDTCQGKPARLLEIQLAWPDSDEKEKNPKEGTYLAKVWLGGDGLPLAATLTRTLKASKLFITVDMNSTEELTFSPLANRLPVLRREERVDVKTLGVGSQMRTVCTFSLK